MSIAGWLPADWSKAILPFAVQNDTGDFVPIGTGFLVGHLYNEKSFNCLITAKHVIVNDEGQPRNDLFLLGNKRGQGIDKLQLSSLSVRGITWKTHPEKDIAAIAIPILPETHDMKKFQPELIEDFSNIKEGDDIFFLGFPLGIGATVNRITPIVRGGMVALKNEDETFLIDANVFPGNSGSPVFFKPCPFKISSSRLELGEIRQPKLLGVITGYIPYEEIAVSPQTGSERIRFQENSGLAGVLSMRFVREVLNSAGFTDMLRGILESERQVAHQT